MDTVVTLLSLLNSLSPLAVIGLLGVIIFLLVKGKERVSAQVETLATNHLHELPSIAETLRRMEETLQRMEVRMSEDFAWLKARVNGRG